LYYLFVTSSGAPLFDSTDSASKLMKIFKLTEGDLSKAHIRTGRKDYADQMRDTAIKSTPPASPYVTTRDKKLSKLAIPSQKDVGLSSSSSAPNSPNSPKSPTSSKGSPSGGKRRPSREGRNSREGRMSTDEPSSPGGLKKKKTPSMREKQPEEATVAEVVPPRAAEVIYTTLTIKNGFVAVCPMC
jgi:hypothetical protein